MNLRRYDKEKLAVEGEVVELQAALTKSFKRVAIARLCMQGLGHDLPDDIPPPRPVESNTYDAMRFLQQVGPGGCCSPRHPTHFESSSLESNGIL